MYYSANKMLGFALHALDGMLGSVVDFYFDEQSWYLRYLVVELGGARTGRKVLVAAPLLGRLDMERRVIDVHLLREQVEKSPTVDGDVAILRRHENALFRHYGWPSFWNGFSSDELFGEGNPWLPHPEELGLDVEQGDPHLRCVTELEGYRLEACDGAVGRIEDFVLDDEVWAVRYLVTRTRTWLAGRNVLVHPDWVVAIHPEEAEVRVDHNCDEVRNSQELVDE
jgi:hypothetical protein